MRIVLKLASMLAWACGASLVLAAPPPGTEGLTRLDLKNEGIRLWYPAAKTKPLKTRPAYLAEYEEAGVFASEPLVLEIGSPLPPLAIACDSGPSADPSCRLLRKFDDPESAVFESAGTDFVFLPDGDIRVSGHTDSLYDHHRLFRFDGKRYGEVTQPFRYVGIEGRTTAPLALTGTKNGGKADVIETVSAGTPVTVLLNAAGGDDAQGRNPDYLVRTREGLVGWAHIAMRPDGSTIVEGLRFAGD